MKAIRRYTPAKNPLPRVKLVRGYIKRNGQYVRPYRRKPRFRKGIVIGYR